MTKKNFITLILSTIGGILFALGMCMCLVVEWDAFIPGVVMGAAGAVVLIIMLLVRRKMRGKSLMVKPSGRTVGAILLSILGVLTFGVGMCMTMIWEGLMIPGIAVGVVGMILVLCLIPVCKGIKG